MITMQYEIFCRQNRVFPDRKINVLPEAMEKFDFKGSYILTFNQKDEITVDGRKISIIPANDFDC